MITENDVGIFQNLFFKEFGVKLSHEAAYRKLSQLVRQIELIYQPIIKKRYLKYVNENGDNNETPGNDNRS